MSILLKPFQEAPAQTLTKADQRVEQERRAWAHRLAKLPLRHVDLDEVLPAGFVAMPRSTQRLMAPMRQGLGEHRYLRAESAWANLYRYCSTVRCDGSFSLSEALAAMDGPGGEKAKKTILCSLVEYGHLEALDAERFCLPVFRRLTAGPEKERLRNLEKVRRHRARQREKQQTDHKRIENETQCDSFFHADSNENNNLGDPVTGYVTGGTCTYTGAAASPTAQQQKVSAKQKERSAAPQTENFSSVSLQSSLQRKDPPEEKLPPAREGPPPLPPEMAGRTEVPAREASHRAQSEAPASCEPLAKPARGEDSLEAMLARMEARPPAAVAENTLAQAAEDAAETAARAKPVVRATPVAAKPALEVLEPHGPRPPMAPRPPLSTTPPPRRAQDVPGLEALAVWMAEPAVNWVQMRAAWIPVWREVQPTWGELMEIERRVNAKRASHPGEGRGNLSYALTIIAGNRAQEKAKAAAPQPAKVPSEYTQEMDRIGQEAYEEYPRPSQVRALYFAKKEVTLQRVRLAVESCSSWEEAVDLLLRGAALPARRTSSSMDAVAAVLSQVAGR